MLLIRAAHVKVKRQLFLPFGEITLLCGPKSFVQDKMNERLDRIILGAYHAVTMSKKRKPSRVNRANRRAKERGLGVVTAADLRAQCAEC